VFAQFPDLGPLRLHSYRAIADRHPGVLVTLVSAIIGVASHLLLDAFTHDGRWGASWLGLDARTVAFPLVGPTTPAHLLQDAGHTVGSLIGLLLFVVIGRDRLMERWYGSEVVTRARRFHLAPSARVWFWTIAGLVAAPVAAVARVGDAAPVFSALLGATLGLLVAGCLPFAAATAPTTEAVPPPEGDGPTAGVIEKRSRQRAVTRLGLVKVRASSRRSRTP
jgi:hypothetical protein